MFNYEDSQRNPLLDRAHPLQDTDLTAIANITNTPLSGATGRPSSRPASYNHSQTMAGNPFELNQSIWSPKQPTARSSLSGSAGAPVATGSQNNNMASGGFFNNSLSPPQSQSFLASSQTSMPQGYSSLIGARRSSAIEPFQLQQMQAQSQAQNNFDTHNQYNDTANYTLWPQTMNSPHQNNGAGFEAPDIGMWQQHQQASHRNSAPETGFFNMNRRHHSVDSNYSEQDRRTIDGALDLSNPGSILETTAPLLQCYKSVDFYFTQDPFKRVTITSESMNHLSTIFEDMVKSGAQLPRFSSAQLPSTQLVLVSFKSGRVDVFYLPDNSALQLKIGDLVVVEADRGRDLGKVLKLDVSIDEARLLKYLQHQEQQAALASFDAASPPASSGNGAPSSSGNNGNNNNNIPTLHFPKPILRFAIPNEVYQILNKQSDEEKARKVCSIKVEGSGLSMRVIDAEYQWDRRKLTFYYTALHRIDFRELVRELFRIYKTRIWMCAVAADADAESHRQTDHSHESQQATNNNDGNGQGFFAPQPFGSQYRNEPNLQMNVGSPSIDANTTNIWNTPQAAPAPSFTPERDLSMTVPRQFSSPDKSLWNKGA